MLCNWRFDSMRRLCTGTGWKESEKVFTDALAKLLTAGPATSSQPNSTQSSSQQAPARRMLASRAQSGHHEVPSASHLLQWESSQQAQHSMHSMLTNSNKGQQGDHSMHSMAASAEGLPAFSSSPAVSHQLPADSPHGLCEAADDLTSVCRDEHQPAWQSHAWESLEASDTDLSLQQCQLLNASICVPSVTLTKKGTRLLVAVYNSLAWERPTEPVRVPVSIQPGVTTHFLVAGMTAVCVQSKVQPCDEDRRLFVPFSH